VSNRISILICVLAATILAACVSLVSLVDAQQPNCKLGCASLTCSLTPSVQNQRYCMKWSTSQAGDLYSYNADSNAASVAQSYNRDPLYNYSKQSNETCGPDCLNGNTASPGSTGDCSDPNKSLTYATTSVRAQLTYCVTKNF